MTSAAGLLVFASLFLRGPSPSRPVLGMTLNGWRISDFTFYIPHSKYYWNKRPHSLMQGHPVRRSAVSGKAIRHVRPMGKDCAGFNHSEPNELSDQKTVIHTCTVQVELRSRLLEN